MAQNVYMSHSNKEGELLEGTKMDLRVAGLSIIRVFSVLSLGLGTEDDTFNGTERMM